VFEKILYPTDFSDVSKKALAYIRSLRSAGAKQVIILHIINEKKVEYVAQGAAWAGVTVAEFLRQTYQRLEDEAHEAAKPIESALKEAGFDVRVMVEKENPYTRILEVAEKENVSAIILGSHGRSNLRSMLLGSVSECVIRHSKQPVIVIKRD